MTAAGGDPDRGRFENGGITRSADPLPAATSSGFAGELAAAFRRLRPQGSARWNFSAAFARLEERFGPRQAVSGPPTGTEVDGTAAPNGTGDGTAGGTPDSTVGEEPERSPLHRLADRYLTGRLRPWVTEQAAAAASRATKEALADERRTTAEGFDAAIEAFRFLGARVEQLEDAAARRSAPVDAVASLAVQPQLGVWTGPIIAWLTETGASGVVLHGECGDGELVGAMVEAGIEARGMEPRGDTAWLAADRGARVEVGEVPDLLRSQPPGSLGGLVLSGVVDRVPVDDLVALVSTSASLLSPGAGLVVVGTRADAAATGWDAVARDLLPGRPLHAETWELLLARAGFVDVGRLTPGPGGDDLPTYAVRARRSS